MLFRNAPWVLLLVVAFLVLVVYISDDQPPAAHPNTAALRGHERSPKASAEVTAGRTGYPTLRPNPLVVGKNKTRLKTILFWNEFYGSYSTYDFGYGHEAFVDNQCKVSTCFATKDRTILPVEQYDAIIIHIRGLPNDWPAKRTVKQRYVMLSIEPPIYLFEYRHLERLHFNWTMTYRLDSDFPIPYAWIDRVSALPAPLDSSLLQRYIVKFGKRAAASESTNLAENKLGLAVQFVSNCHSSSHREHYVRELKKYAPVDVYGKCGEFKCPKEKSWECYKMAESKYKFYLSFEDSMCKDYATEKFFTMYSLDMVPVVLGGANYSQFAPPHSFINAADFETPKALAHYLKLLDSDDAKFNEFFWWKDHYRRRFHHHRSLCDLCERLHEDAEPKTYPDMQDWWVKQAQCTHAFKGSSSADYY